MVTQLIYTSQASESFLNSEYSISIKLNAICAKARKLNLTIGVTGILLFNRGGFLQVLEGNHIVLKKLYEKICADPRHCHHERLAVIESNQRYFDSWNMGLLNLEEVADWDRAIFDESLRKLRYASEEDDELKHTVIRSLLRTFVDQTAAVSTV